MDANSDPRALARLVECSEAAACADLARAAPRAFGFAVDESAHAVALYAAAVDAFLFNRVLAVGVLEPADPGRTAVLLARYRALARRRYGVTWSPAAAPADFPAALARLGLAPRDTWCKMWRDAARSIAPAATDLVVAPVAAAHAARFGEVAVAGFGMPAGFAPVVSALVGREGWHTYLAWDGRVPVAAGALFVQGTVGWLGVAATLPAARRRGAQGALLARRLEDGAALGCTQFVTETGAEQPGRPNPSLHNMRRAGFAAAYERTNHLPGTEGT